MPHWLPSQNECSTGATWNWYRGLILVSVVRPAYKRPLAVGAARQLPNANLLGLHCSPCELRKAGKRVVETVDKQFPTKATMQKNKRLNLAD